MEALVGTAEDVLVYLGNQSVLRIWPQGIGNDFVVTGETVL